MNNLAHPSEMQLNPEVAVFFDQQSNTFSYVIQDPTSDACAIVDSVLDFDYPSGHFSTAGADAIKEYIQSATCEWSGTSRPMFTPTICQQRRIYKSTSAASWL